MLGTRERIIFWLGVVILLLVTLHAVSSILLPFIVGILVAYFLDPAADKLESWGCSRFSASIMIIAAFFAVAITSAAILLPVLYDQMLSLSLKLPGYIQTLQDNYGQTLSKFISLIDGQVEEKSDKVLSISSYALKYSGKFLKSILESGAALLGLLSLIFISPIVAFYMLRDYDKMIARIDSWLPQTHAKTIREQIKLMDKALSGFIRGMANVCFILGVFYAIGLSLVGLDFGLLIGFCTGLISFIPYVGMIIGMAVGMGVAFFQYGPDIISLGMVLGVFVIGQVIEGNFLTPNLVGNRVNVHALWIIFALLAGGSLFGFVGVLLAVPFAAVLAVLIRFALNTYLNSSLYSIKNGSASKRKAVARQKRKKA